MHIWNLSTKICSFNATALMTIIENKSHTRHGNYLHTPWGHSFKLRILRILQKPNEHLSISMLWTKNCAWELFQWERIKQACQKGRILGITSPRPLLCNWKSQLKLANYKWETLSLTWNIFKGFAEWSTCL